MLSPGSNPISWILSLLTAGAQQQQADQAYAENKKRYGQSTDINLGQLGSGNSLGDIGWAARDAGIDLPSLRAHNADILKEFDMGGAGLLDRLRGTGEGLRKDYEAGAQAIQGGFDERLRRNLDYVNQMGEQERKDINTAFDQNEGTNLQDAAARGLGGSTIAQGLRTNNQVERRNALGRLNDRLLGTRLNTDSSLSGDAANAAMNLFQGRQGLVQNNAANEFNLDNSLTTGRTNLRDSQFKDAFNFGNQALGNLNATISGATDAYPSQSTFMDALRGFGQNIGYNNARAAQPSAWSSIFGNIGASAVGGLTGGLTGGLAGGIYGGLAPNLYRAPQPNYGGNDFPTNR